MKRLLFVGMLCLVVGAWCLADSFIIKEKPATRRTRQQMKQEISQLMASLIEQSSLSLEREARIQQRLCKEVRTFVEGTQDSMLNKGSIKDLEHLQAGLNKELRRRTEQLAAQNSFLDSLA